MTSASALTHWRGKWMTKLNGARSLVLITPIELARSCIAAVKGALRWDRRWRYQGGCPHSRRAGGTITA